MTNNLCSHSLDYALDEIRDDLLKRRYEHHLPTCSACAQEVAEYRDILSALLLTDTCEFKAQSVGTETENSRKIIAFPRPRKISSSPIHGLVQRFGKRNAMLSISLTVAAMTLAVLVHGNHVKSVALYSDLAFDHVTQTVKVDSSHIKHDFWRL